MHCAAQVGTAGYPTLRYFEPLVEGSDAPAKQPAGENYADMNRAADDLLWFARDRMEKVLSLSLSLSLFLSGCLTD